MSADEAELNFQAESFLSDAQFNYDGSFLSLLHAAAAYPQAVLERVCQTMRQQLLDEARIEEADLDRLDLVVQLDAGCTRQLERCGMLIEQTLDTVMDAADFPDVLALFPPLAQHNCLSVHRVRFMRRFGKFIEKKTVDGWVMQLHGELFPKIQFETQSRMLHHLDWMRRKWRRGAGSKKGGGKTGLEKNAAAAKTGLDKSAAGAKTGLTKHPLASVAKMTLLTRIPRLVYHHHAQRKDEPTGVPAHEIVAMFRKRLVRRAAVGVKAGPIAKLFLEVTQELA